jgi:hypothetical protein
MSLPVFRRFNFLRLCNELLMLLIAFTIFRIATAFIFNTTVIPDTDVLLETRFVTREPLSATSHVSFVDELHLAASEKYSRRLRLVYISD